ncbi:helix-turn-helix domain-containing protein [bacterium]|nr:helix-turn-helix domain-containing protein [bacterium]
MNDGLHKEWASMSDKALIQTIGKFIKQHRLNQNRSQSVVAKAAGISRSTLSLLERGEKVSIGSLMQVLRILDLLHIMTVFEVDDEISPIEYAKLKKKQKQRASRKNGALSQRDEGVEW